jgi:hypothetical protein
MLSARKLFATGGPNASDLTHPLDEAYAVRHGARQDSLRNARSCVSALQSFARRARLIS